MRIYRRKDGIEKFFDNMKNEIKRKRIRSHKKETFEGRLFLDFIALIIYSKIIKEMGESRINKEYSLQEIMYELKKIKMIQIGERKKIITEVSKTEREILKKFKISSPDHITLL